MRWPSKMNSHGLNHALFPLLPSLQMIDLYFISSKPVPKDHLHSYTWYLVLSNDPPVTKRGLRQRTEGWAAIQPSIQGYFTARVSLPVRIEWKTWLIVTFMTHCRFPSNLWTLTHLMYVHRPLFTHFQSLLSAESVTWPNRDANQFFELFQ